MHQQTIDYHSPNTVENFAIRKDADVDIGDDDVVKMAFSFVREEQIGHPHLLLLR